MRTYDYLLGLSLLALVACNQENMPERPTPTPGAEVKFGVSLNKTDVTRTIYGDENNNAFPIYWVQGDKVLVTSPQCLNGRNTAQYEVSVKTATQNYATSLNKTGAVGVQWGQDDTADFYSVYPADKASVIGTIFSLTMPNVQRDQVQLDNKKAYADMNACFMGAVSKEVANGSEVNLTYKPLSTAIRFTLRGPSASVGQTDSEVIISKVVLKANQPIAGDFTVDMSTETPTMELGTNTYNEITLYTYYASTGGHLALRVGESVELNAFVIPHKDLAVNDNWKLEVTTAEGVVYTTSLKGTGDGKLMPGKIHRFLGQLPSLPAPTNEWDPSNWMVNIPRNVYLSEISIPGSWNSLNDDYQDVNGSTEAICKAAIDAQYTAGVRAFHIDTRWTPNRDPLVGYNFVTKPTIVRLGTAVGGDSNNWDGKKFTRKDNLSFANALEYIASHVQPEEYMMVFCTFAQKSYEEKEGGWMQAVSDACAANNKIINARTISANTVVGDVLGKVIVIVNCAKDPQTIDNLPTGSKCLFTYTPLELDKNQYTNPNFLYYTGAIVNCADASLNMFSAQAQIMASPMDATKGYTVSGRGYAPTWEQRKQKTENILKWSLDNFQKTNYAHRDWLYNGLGGYLCESGGKEVKGSYREVAEKLNLWIDDKIKKMSAHPDPSQEQTRYFPVGMVLMNYVTDAVYGKPVLLDILSINNKFRKAYDPNKDPLDPSNNGSSSDVNSAAPGYNSGMKDKGTDAIGWTRSH
ncbi:MAG: fimbrillin family protein [Bacteroidaceae bacterium]|nr:fimbrillin family protein [Bacteroidaceae bacterium]